MRWGIRISVDLTRTDAHVQSTCTLLLMILYSTYCTFCTDMNYSALLCSTLLDKSGLM